MTSSPTGARSPVDVHAPLRAAPATPSPARRPPAAPPGRLHCLDGFRALAVALVVVGHAWSPWADGVTDAFARNVGGHGVTVFLVISGFLITMLLERERTATGRVHLGRFYLRRALRLWPALWVLVATVVALSAAGVVRLRDVDLVSSLLFVQNYVTGAPAGTLRHTWSLSLEEQFYLAWPLLLLLVPRRHLRWGLAAAIAAAPLLRVALFHLDPAGRDVMNFAFHTRYDSLAVGCLVALLWDAPEFQRALAWADARHGSALALGLVLVTVVVGAHVGREVMYPAGYTVENLGIAYLVAQAVSHPTRPCFRWLQWRPLVLLGTLSYSLYLWQQVFVVAKPGPFVNPWWAVAASLAAASASYLLLERPLQRLRGRLRHSPATGGGAAPAAGLAGSVAPRELTLSTRGR